MVKTTPIFGFLSQEKHLTISVNASFTLFTPLLLAIIL
jgi:hypothetical protein